MAVGRGELEHLHNLAGETHLGDDFGSEGFEFGQRGQSAPPEQKDGLGERHILCQVTDVVTLIEQPAMDAVYIGDACLSSDHALQSTDNDFFSVCVVSHRSTISFLAKVVPLRRLEFFETFARVSVSV
jgi:hypothetical protein